MPFSLTMSDLTLSEIDDGSRVRHEEALPPMDEAAFRAFYDRTARPLRLYLARIARDPQAADDLLQETYYRFYRAGSVYEDEKHRRNSLFQIATNLVRDRARRNRNIRHVSIDDDSHQEELQAEDRTADQVQGRADLARAMAHLNPAQREMLWLAYALGSSHAEIAEIVGVKSGSVKLLLFRARRKLAKLLRGTEPEGGARVED